MQYTLQLATVLALGALGTIKIAFVALVISLPLGLVVGAGRYSRTKLFRWPATVFVETFRNIPVLVSIMWFFFAFPMLVPFEISAYTAATMALSLNTSAFFAEVFRAGIQSIAPGQWDGARALGMSYRYQMRRIILPQAIRRMIPAFTNRWIELFKLTALASTISYHDLMYTTKTIANAYYNPVEMYSVAGVIYLVLIYPMVRATYRLESPVHGDAARG
jgi:polar amino acid transport system permease protein